MENKEFNLTNENYHSTEARQHYLGTSMFKEFLKCEKMALAKVNGEFEDKSSDALTFGSYVDAYFSGELDQFLLEHPEMFKKDGTLLAKYSNIQEVIDSIENTEDEKGNKIMMKYLDGEKQKIMTGVIAGVPFKIKMDAYHPGKVIVDQKVMKDMEPVWVERDGRNVQVDFIEAYRYDIQGAIYQEIESQNSKDHKKLPFVLAVTTKEECPNNELIRIDQEYLDLALEEVKAKAPRYWAIIQGKEQPKGCGHCPACRKDKKVTGVMSYKKLFKESEE